MNAIIPFDFERQPIRVIDRDGQPWFVLADVCRALEIGNPSDAARRLADDEKDALDVVDPMGRMQSATIISESGLWSLVLTSRKKAALVFKRWLTGVVLPSLRQSGSYSVAGPALPRDPRELLAYIAQQAGDMVGLQDALAALEPKADALDRLADAEGMLCLMDAGKALGVPPRRAIAWMEANRWIFKRSGSDKAPWIAFEPPRRAGLLAHKGSFVPVRGRPDKWVEQVMVTPKGLARLAELGAGR